MKRLRGHLSGIRIPTPGPIVTMGGLLLVCLWLVKLLYFPTLGFFGTPIASLDKTIENMGDLSIEEDGVSTFTIKNAGTAPLKISDIQTSCNCVFVNVTMGGITTGKFTHPSYTKPSLRGWSGEISPNQSATFEVIFSPDDYIVYGHVIRQAIIATNDPDHPTITLEIRANVLEQ